MNNFCVSGFTGRDGEIRSGLSGTNYATISLAWSKKDKSGKESTTWSEVVAFGQAADRLASVRKGEKLYVTGSCNLESWTKKDGTQAVTLKITASHFERANPERNTSPEAAVHEDPIF